MRLVQYAERYPGRLGARLLQKMAHLTSRSGEASVADLAQAPVACATSYFLSLMQPAYPNMGMRTSRELRALCLVMDYLARGKVDQAADAIGQRIKALEKSISDQGWARAQHCELVPSADAGLLEKDEEQMLAKELELDMKLRPRAHGRGQQQQSTQHQPAAAGGQFHQKGGRGKGKGWRPKGSGKGGGGTGAPPPAVPPA